MKIKKPSKRLYIKVIEMTLIDKWNDFFDLLKSKNVQPSTQLTYFHLLNFWNAARRPIAFYLSDRELANSTHLSLHSITIAKNVLKNFGLLNWKIVNGRTKFFLPQNSRYAVDDTNEVQSLNDGGLVEVQTNKISNREQKKSVSTRRQEMDDFNAKYKNQISEAEKLRMQNLIQEKLAKLNQL